MELFFDYLPSGPMEEAWGLHVSAYGQGVIAPRQPYPPAGHPSGHDFSWREGRVLSALQVVLISKGQGVFETRTSGPIRVRPGSCFLVLPGVWHRYRPDPAKGWTEHWVELNGRIVEEWLRSGLLEMASPVIVPPAQLNLRAEFQSLIKIARAKRPGYRPVLAAKAWAILSAIVAEASVSSSHPPNPDLQATHHLLSQQMTEGISMADIARCLSMSYSTFHRQFRKATGLSPKHYAEQMRLAHAQQLLASTRLGLKEIAARLHYSSPFHLSRQFKLRYGMAPTQWRRKQREDFGRG